MLRTDTTLFVLVSFSKFANLYSRSKPILEGAGEYFIEHGMTLNTPQVFSISRLYGELDFHPPNGFKFWDILEHVLVSFCDSNFTSCGGLEVEMWTDNSLPSASVDQILNGTMYLYGTRYIYKVYRRVICDMYCVKMIEI